MTVSPGDMKVHILYQTALSPAGGGNQFLKALEDSISLKGARASSVKEAHVVLFNSHQYTEKVSIEKRRAPKKVFVHRVDGPIRLYNSWSDKRDYLVKAASALISDGTIFQSQWSRKENYRLGFHRNRFDRVILNAVNPKIFNRQGKRPFMKGKKARLIATNWSPNPRKGFDVYHWLDYHLDFSQFEMTFVGNSPIPFKNIVHVRPLSSTALARTLKEHDIYIFASKIEACSNALLEALHCGLPAIAYNFSSNPEIIGKGGELFERPEEIPSLLERIVRRYPLYFDRISVPSMDEASAQYLDFMYGIYESVRRGEYIPKRFGLGGLAILLTRLFAWRLYGKISARKKLKGHRG